MVTPLIPKARKYTATVRPHGLNLPGTMLGDPKKGGGKSGRGKVNPSWGRLLRSFLSRQSRHKRSTHLQIPGHSVDRFHLDASQLWPLVETGQQTAGGVQLP